MVSFGSQMIDMNLKGQIPVMAAIIGAIAIPVASVFVAWITASGTANDKISDVRTEVRVVEERENNHYDEVQKQLTVMNEILQGAPWNKTTLK